MEVLDKGHVIRKCYMGSDELVANAARVSFAKEVEEFSEKDEKLIQYLAKHKHWTPFAHPQVTLHVKAPLFVRTQLYKHKVGLTENEVSRRYVDDAPEFYIPSHFRARPEGMKQGSTDDVCKIGNARAYQRYKNAIEVSYSEYTRLLEGGVAPEVARGVLPECTYTEWYWTGSLAAFARVFHQRSDTHAQWETQQYAKAIHELIKPLFPVSWNALAGHYEV